ncbi:4387_t:CDS:10, partial [Acaulospora morrowiae]
MLISRTQRTLLLQQKIFHFNVKNFRRTYFLPSHKRALLTTNLNIVDHVNHNNSFSKATSTLTLEASRARAYTSPSHGVPSTSPSVVSPEITNIRSQALNLDNPLLILPQPCPFIKEDGLISSTDFSEKFAILHACLKLREVGRAKKILEYLYEYSPRDMYHLLDINVHNAYLEALVVVHYESALIWLDTLDEYGLKPDLTTFSILIRGFLRVSSEINGLSLLKALNYEMEQNGFTLDQLVKNDLLLDEEIVQLIELFNNEKDPDHDSRLFLEKLTRLHKSEQSISIHALADEHVSAVEEHVSSSTDTVPGMSSEQSPAKMAIGVKLMKSTLEALKETQLSEYERQIRLEENALHAAIERWKYEHEQLRKIGKPNPGVADMKKCIWDWHEALVPLIQDELKMCKNLNGYERAQYGPFLQMLSAEKLSAITIMEMIRQNGAGGIIDGMKITRGIMAIGKAVESEYNVEQLKKKQNRKLIGKDLSIQELFSSGKLFNMTIRRAAAKIEEGQLNTTWQPEWPLVARAKIGIHLEVPHPSQIGSILAGMLIDVAKIQVSTVDANGKKITEMVPAFFHSYEYTRGKKIGVIKLNPQLIKWLSVESVGEHLHPRMLPMLIHPKPWLTYNSGGYMTSPTLAMRTKECPEQIAYLKKASELHYLERVFAGLDVLGSTCWAINNKVYDVVLEIWNSGEGAADIPPANLNLEMPEKPPDFETNLKSKAQWVKACKDITQKVRNNYSMRCSVNYKVDIAGAYLNESMYFPHSLDFRGRAYPIPSHLNHLGDDLCRGLLMFRDAKPLGKVGLKWLKIHMANLAGFDKASFEERIKYTEEHIDDIMDSADKPLTGRRWWQKSEDPWQCLSACFEITEAIRSGNPESYESRIPVHQDGTCNGLQHYAALGGDLIGATQVNLAPSEAPSDIYSGVAERVRKLVDEDAEKGDENAIILQGKISRKVVKQTVMTNVYGVTFIGARIQIEARLKEIKEIPADKTHELSIYVTGLVFSCLGEMFNGARAIQTWLNDCAKWISKSVPSELVLKSPEEISEEEKRNGTLPKNSKKSIVKIPPSQPEPNQMTAVVWTTPLDLPIVQPYRKMHKKMIKTDLQVISFTDSGSPSPVNRVKQRAAFPPNFIHSLDATHMLMSALSCKEKGLTFASVHDSYWTHACDVEVMNEVIREQFIKLHEQPIMENLRNEFLERYKGYKVPVKVLRSEFEKLKLEKANKLGLETTDNVEEAQVEITDNGYEDILSLDELSKILPKPPKDDLSKNPCSINDIMNDLDNDEVNYLIDNNVDFEKIPDQYLADEHEREEERRFKTGTKRSKYVYVWADLDFPELPKK